MTTGQRISPGQRIADGLASVRERTEAIVSTLDDTALTGRAAPIMSPPVWDLAHIAAYEELWVWCRVGGERPQHPDLQAAYDAFETPRAVRTSIRLLDPPQTREFMRVTRERALEVLDGVDLGADDPLVRDGMVFELVRAHEAQHAETLLQGLQLLPAGGYRPPDVPGGPDAVRPPAAPARIRFDGGTVRVGSAGTGFAYDCERPRHGVVLAPFAIARDPVTCGEHLEFIRDGGYRRPELWTAEGWAWREQEGAEAPLYWERDGEGGWLVRTFDRVAPVDPSLPVCHVSWYEADAHARWAGGRLPTEHEWEAAAAGAVPDPAAANIGATAFSPLPPGALPGTSDAGCRAMLGDVWEWTSSHFTGYPGFRAFPYREYAEVFFGEGHRVLRGGSWASQPHVVSPAFRNWDLPQRRQIFAGLRLAWDAEGAR